VGFKSPAEDLKGYKRLRRKGAAFSSLAPTYGMMPRRSRFLVYKGRRPLMISLDSETSTLKVCTIPNCGRPVSGRGLCAKHYLQARRAGIPAGPNRTERAMLFIEFCLRSATNECIVAKFKPRSPYPTIKVGGKECKVGWLILERTEALRPDGQEMRHLCGNTKCCNPRHLTWGTHLDNMDDWKRHGCAGDRSGSKNGNAKLTDQQRAEIRARYRMGRGPYDPGNSAELSREYGVSGTTIRVIAGGH
jgi:hypothetical protein